MQAIAYSRYGAPEVLGTVTLPRPEAGSGSTSGPRPCNKRNGGRQPRPRPRPPAGFRLIGRLVFGLFRPRRQVLGTEFSGDG
jgi:hypothetical protein